MKEIERRKRKKVKIYINKKKEIVSDGKNS